MNFPLKDLIQYLVECDLTHNDANVYLWLLKAQIANPSEIAEGTGIKRPRVYDSLKRLMERGFVIQELAQKRPQYKAVNARVLIKDLNTQIDSKMQAVENINKYIIEQPPIPGIKGVFFFNSDESLRLQIDDALKASQKTIKIMAITDSSLKDESLLPSDLLSQKAQSNQDVTLLLNVNAKNWEICADLFAKKIKICHFPQINQLSTIIHLIDANFLAISYFKLRKGAIMIEYGIVFSQATGFIAAFDFLIQSFIDHSITLQKRMEELKKSIIYPTDKLKSLFGVDE